MDDEIAPVPLAARLAWLLDARAWRVLDARAGFQDLLTYAALARDLGITRGRVWQLHINLGHRLAHPSRLGLLRDILTTLDAAWPPPAPPDEGGDGSEGSEGSREELGKEVVPAALRTTRAIVDAAGYGPATDQDARRLLLLPRALVDLGDTRVRARYPRLAYAACALPPAILAHPTVAAAAERLRREAERAQRKNREHQHALTYGALAAAVLREAATPLHWTEIAARAEALGHRSPFTPRALFNALASGVDTFVRVGPGAYGLAAWGAAPAPPYPALIARVLRAAGHPLPPDEIRRQVDQVRPITATSLQMVLDLHARLYRSVEGTYGLRAWLPSDPEATAPCWQVEDRRSARRVAYAQARGIDVARMTARDAAVASDADSDADADANADSVGP